MSQGAPTEIVGIAEHYAAFIKLCRLRIDQLGVPMETIDAVCGFSPRYTTKLFCEDKAMSVVSLFTMLDALGLRMCLQHDEAKLAKLRRREDWIKMRRKGARYRGKHGSGVIRVVNHIDFYRQIGRKGALKRYMLQSKRRQQTAKARAARWGRQ